MTQSFRSLGSGESPKQDTQSATAKTTPLSPDLRDKLKLNLPLNPITETKEHDLSAHALPNDQETKVDA